MRVVGLWLAVVFFFCGGLIYLFRPKQLRDRALRSYYEIGVLDPALGSKKIMFTRTYIWSCRIGGVISIAVSAFLVWIYFHHPHGS